ncbi:MULTISPECIES: branched-chain amino acid ABC transporter permease [Paraburkholderia]|uniref:Branched-chain amino acid ABC transporter permease n=1 Tax=Paraburkholderia madseniana TaxID=2599607 RepID=A0AAP5EUR8_9BURK|nr:MULTISPECIES: branched-chain amino acid ABC transporter permease [Paraburkholderia]MCX4144990.1 branched-chain amino acid ABC transporter permease [Paraburkholderia madseniana]MDN7147942.1 branched-chain amino acid ABC transporter permease [Paraburkholderia sp. WS6]MDQ6406822.1 branched-chain amino acid ABC transporter permease [Paraburkholderia madseniana]
MAVPDTSYDTSPAPLTSSNRAADSTLMLPGRTRDWAPQFLILALIAVAFLVVRSVPTWITLTVAALAMGMMLFVMASGLTLVFGLMDVMNFGHAGFVAVGAYSATLLVGPVNNLLTRSSTLSDFEKIAIILLSSMTITALVGWIFERLFIKPVYGNYLKQILITIGALIIVEQALLVIFGSNQMLLPRPETLRGSLAIGNVSIERYRLVAVGLGAVVFALLTLLLNFTRIGLLIRAGVENYEMVEALGYRTRRIFVAVFVAGSALAGLGGAMWGFYNEQFTFAIGSDVLVPMLIIVIIGGPGSITGCFIGAILVALVSNYVNFLLPDLALISNIAVMMLVLLWRPRGLLPLSKH